MEQDTDRRLLALSTTWCTNQCRLWQSKLQWWLKKNIFLVDNVAQGKLVTPLPAPVISAPSSPPHPLSLSPLSPLSPAAAYETANATQEYAYALGTDGYTSEADLATICPGDLIMR
jgi:hypothetical protein